MKTMKKFLGMAVLALAGTAMTGCSNEDSSISSNQQQLTNTGKVETLTATVGLDGDGTTRALTPQGYKTFAEGETMAVVYRDNDGNTMKAVSAPLTPGDIHSGSKRATFTFELTNPDKMYEVTFIYPAAMAKADGSVNYDALYTEQDGTLAKLATSFDYCTYTAGWDGAHLPSLTLENQLAIMSVMLDNSTGSHDITGDVTGLTISDGTHYYAVSRPSAAAGPIYVAIRPTSGATVHVSATDGSNNYTKTLTGKTYEASKKYNVEWRMTKAAPAPSGAIDGKYSVSSTMQVFFSQGNLRARTTDLGASWTWTFAAYQWNYIGNAAANTSMKADGTGTVTANGTVDLFGWVGASSTWTTAARWGISASTATGNVNGYGNVASETLKSDWGNAIGSGWRTPTKDEWAYVFNTRGTASGIRYAKAQVNGVNGVVLLPDDWSTAHYALASANTQDAAFTTNVITSKDWNDILEAHGAVFLPVTGQRNSSSVEQTTYGYYYTSTPDATNARNAYALYFAGDLISHDFISSRSTGRAVRLVYNAD